MSKQASTDEKKPGGAESRIEQADGRATPGTGEEEAAADIQPKDVENGTAR